MVLKQEKMQATQELQDLSPIKTTRELEYEPGDQELPWAAYASMQVKDGNMHIAEAHSDNVITYTKPLGQEDATTEMLNWLKQAARQRYLQWIAAGIQEKDHPENVLSRLWLEEDIVPFVIRKQDGGHEQSLQEQVMDVISKFNENNIVRTQLNEKHEVQVSELVTLEDYQKNTSPEDFTLLVELAQALQGKKLVFINATPQGGGVALMRHALIRLLRLLHVDAHWYVLQPKKEVFAITKAKFHNVLQAVASRETELTLEDQALYEAWMQENAAALEDVFKQADAIVIDDPQPAGLIPYIKQANPDVKVIYRSHIQIVGSLASQEGTPQHTTWSFLWDKIRDADYFVSHPMNVFIPGNVPDEKILYMPATTDPLDGLNKPLTQGQISIYLKLFNELLRRDEQTPLDEERPYIIQIARFDPSKGIPDVLEAYKKLREMLKKQRKPVPQLVITGNSSIDDPDAIPVYNHIKKLLQSERYERLADDVKVVRLPHRDQMLNALLRGSKLALQLSVKEGFEVKVTEALMKGKPVIAYNAGGIPLQIQDGITGYLVERGDTTQVAQHLYNLLTDESAYQRMSEAACENAGKDYLTIPNAISWLYLAGQLVRGEKVEGNCQWVRALVREKYGK
ncbi:MAG TPA: glycosyltransferase [Ktedonobacteraceae bacterium]|nr:glycosyltransferase [Ktedonobacteraceae bacterium]